MSGLPINLSATLWKTGQCGNCIYFEVLPAAPGAVIGGPKIGECRFNPPVPVVAPRQLPGGQVAMAIEIVNVRVPDSFPACGQFKPKSNS